MFSSPKKNFFVGCALLGAVLFCFVGMFIYESLELLLRVFPLDDPESVIFTFTHNVLGAQNLVRILLMPKLASSLENIFFILSFVALIWLAIILFFRKKFFPAGKLGIRDLFRKFLFPFLLSVLVIDAYFVLFFFSKFPVKPYVDMCEAILLDRDSENILYDNDYVSPDSVSLNFEKSKNLLFIVLESMEYNFQDSANGGNLKKNQIPEITNLIKSNVAFEPGGISVSGTGWTMGATIANSCGLPLLMPVNGNSYGVRNFMRNAVCLTDLLRQNGYAIGVAKGASKRFASMDYFLKAHGVEDEFVYDVDFFEKKGIEVIEDSSFFHSITDETLYREVQKLISDMTRRYERWFFLFYTVDTHGPHGRLTSECSTTKNIETARQYHSILHCSSKLLDAFINWAKQQPWFKTTTIVVIGDHPAMIAPEVVGFLPGKMQHYWIDFFINSAEPQPLKQRVFTAFDMYPTILEAMGAKIEGHALGLGRSLFSNEPTLIEKYGKDSLNALIKKKGAKYKSFWD